MMALPGDLRKIKYPNRAYRAVVDMSRARSRSSLTQEYGIVGKSFCTMTVIDQGSGEYVIEILFDDGSSIELKSGEIVRGMVVEMSFRDVLMTNESQPDAQSPVFVFDWVDMG